KPRKTAKKKEKNYLYEVRQYSVNQSKWAAARAYAKKRGWQFVLWTEKELWNGIDKGFKKKK
ncbi:MAG: hypothetical protein KAS32_24255, partial [Candidatus Peribacteraceae bacterium]|nr:hypothetical protein [Candidatus Peribacteraceae bacterium]